ncbi:MAG: glutathione S-transferase family protein [Pseudomonadota bacterium]
MSQPDLTIYHLEGRRCERIVWLCEELELPYELVFTQGDLRASMAAVYKVNPLFPVAPTVSLDGDVLVESGAILELLVDRYAPGRLKPAVASPDYPAYLQWLHFAEASFAARTVTEAISARIRRAAKLPDPEPTGLMTVAKALGFVNDHLSRQPYFGGSEFSLADIMMVFPTDLTEWWRVADVTPYAHLERWRQDMKARPAYQRMLTVARPAGIPGL